MKLTMLMTWSDSYHAPRLYRKIHLSPLTTNE